MSGLFLVLHGVLLSRRPRGRRARARQRDRRVGEARRLATSAGDGADRSSAGRRRPRGLRGGADRLAGSQSPSRRARIARADAVGDRRELLLHPPNSWRHDDHRSGRRPSRSRCGAASRAGDLAEEVAGAELGDARLATSAASSNEELMRAVPRSVARLARPRVSGELRPRSFDRPPHAPRAPSLRVRLLYERQTRRHLAATAGRRKHGQHVAAQTILIGQVATSLAWQGRPEACVGRLGRGLSPGLTARGDGPSGSGRAQWRSCSARRSKTSSHS